MAGVRQIARGVLTGLCAVALVLSGTALGSEPEATPPPVYPVKRVSRAPLLDGILDDPAWEEVSFGVLEWNVDDGTLWTDVTDTEVRFKAVWREDALYLALLIDDDERFVDSEQPERSDRVVLYVTEYFGDAVGRWYTIPLFQSASLEDPDAPFVVWGQEGRTCEIRLDVEAMYAEPPEMGLNLFYMDADTGQPETRLGWVAPSTPYETPQGIFRFFQRLDPSTTLMTTWGRMKSLY
ncbi:MAG: hypothetical protein KatS3mg115_2297 [Candidatus Poribacteria bacterium]|nr:MAG: hypothetical protein KatS3mg115_2297 [Candidatus Poribacteria bacterium]